MEQKTKVNAEEGKQEVVITRTFELPVELLFKAFAEADIVAQWMGTNVLKLESKPHGSYQFETKNAKGDVVFRANGTIHSFVLNDQIIRTFEMENTPFGVQLDFLEFKKLSDNTSKLVMRSVYESQAQRNQVLQLPFVQGINMAHNRLQEIGDKLK